MGATIWSSTTISFSSGFSYSTQSACDGPSLDSEQVLACVPVTISITQNAAPTRRVLNRKLVITPTTAPFQAEVQLSLPTALLTNLGSPGSYAVLRNTDPAAFASSTAPACSIGSSSSDYNSGSVTATLCAHGSYSVRIVVPVLTPGVSTAPTSNITGFTLPPAAIAGVAVGAFVLVVVALVATRAILRSRPGSSNKIVPEPAAKKALPKSAWSLTDPNGKSDSPRAARNVRGLVHHDSALSMRGRSDAVKPIGTGVFTPRVAHQADGSERTPWTTADEGAVAVEMIDRASPHGFRSASPRAVRAESPRSLMAMASQPRLRSLSPHSASLQQLAVEGPKLLRPTPQSALGPPKPSLYNLATRNMAMSAMPRTLSASSMHAARLASGEVSIPAAHSLAGGIRSPARTNRAHEDVDTSAQRMLDSLLDEIRAADEVSTKVLGPTTAL